MNGEDGTDEPTETDTDADAAEGLVSTRRAALALLGSVGGAGLFASGTSAETDPETAIEPTEAEATLAEQAEEPDLPDGTEALVAFLEAKYGDQLTREELNELRGDVAGNIRAARALDEVELANGTGPAYTFRAYRGEE